MSKLKAGKAIIDGILSLSKESSVKKSLFGVYADGSTRSLADAINGEFLSPKQREKMTSRKKKKKHKKKKNKIRL